MPNSIKNNLQNLLSGKGEVRFGATIQAITHYLEESKAASWEVEDLKFVKKQEAERLENYITQNNLWKKVDIDKYVSEGIWTKGLIGFTKQDGVHYAIVEQAFVTFTDPTDLDQVKAFLFHNGFTNTRNNDYLHEELGIILEDLHDENVLTSNGILYFIDTVFYRIKR